MTAKLVVDGAEVPLEDLRVVGLRPGDQVIVTVGVDWTVSQMHELSEFLKTAFPRNSTFVFPAEDVAIARPES